VDGGILDEETERERESLQAMALRRCRTQCNVKAGRHNFDRDLHNAFCYQVVNVAIFFLFSSFFIVELSHDKLVGEETGGYIGNSRG
jgi:hypothetical protein